tara:strand:+ start:730 stop:1086 length:357 start_codon:yes stop_codon:yes gene_type:complete
MKKYTPLDYIDRDIYTQVCAWVGTACKLADTPMAEADFETFMEEELDFRVKYIDEYRTHDDSNPDRVDLLFALHEDDVNRMVTDRFTTFNGEVKWYEDYVVNSKSVIPKSRVLPNVTW